MAAPLLLIAAGGTGGHMFPAQALAEAMIGRGWRVKLSTDARGARGAGRKPGLTQLKHKTITTATKNAAPKAAAKTAAKGAPARLVRPGKTSK